MVASMSYRDPWKIVVFGGSRTWTDTTMIEVIMMGNYAVLGKDMFVFTGGAPGADRIADGIAKANGVPSGVIDAIWGYYGNAAGPMRNRWQLRFQPLMVNLFLNHGKSPGTKDMITACENLGIKPAIFRP